MTSPDQILPPPVRDAGPLETMARAMCEQHIREVRRWDTDPAKLEATLPAAVDVNWQDHVAVAQAAITALTEAGYAIVPIEPTEAMLANEPCPAEAQGIYRAMIAAASPIDTKEGE